MSEAQLAATEWKCQLQPSQWTVGERVDLSCSGPTVGNLSMPVTLVVQSDKPDDAAYTLTVLEVKRLSPNEVDLVVTGYKPGSYDHRQITVNGGAGQVVAKDLTWNIQSVIPQGEKVEPFGPIGPIGMSLPWWYWGLWAAVILTAIFVIYRRFKKSADRKRLIESLKVHNTVLAPFHQFHRDFRGMVKQIESPKSFKASQFVSDLDQHLRLFLVREYLVPALEWPQRQILKELGAKPNIKDLIPAIGKVMNELDRAKTQVDKVSVVDCEQLLGMVRALVDQLNSRRRVKT